MTWGAWLSGAGFLVRHPGHDPSGVVCWTDPVPETGLGSMVAKGGITCV